MTVAVEIIALVDERAGRCSGGGERVYRDTEHNVKRRGEVGQDGKGYAWTNTRDRKSA